jgi:hypothetical protein
MQQGQKRRHTSKLSPNQKIRIKTIQDQFRDRPARYPNAVELVTCYADWAERNEQMFEEIRGLLCYGFFEKDYLKKADYVA